MYIDIHAHLDFKQFDQDRDSVIRRAFDGGVEKIINVGADLESSRRSVELAERRDRIFASVGIHPHEFNALPSGEEQEAWFGELKELAKNKKVVAIGEAGLDYFSHTENPITEEQKEKQKKGFVAQLKIAKELGLPVVIHARDSYGDVREIIRNYPSLKFVFHCYGGNLKFTQELLRQNNIYFSFAGNVTYAKQNNEIIEVVKMIPLEKMMVETDCPYLAPMPHRGKRNESVFVSYVSEKIAEIKGISVEKAAEATTRNAELLFNF